MSDKHDIEAAGLADYSKDVCRIATVLEKRDEIIDRLRADNKALLDALKGARTNVAYAHQPENCGDHCRNNCRDCVLKNTLEDLDAAIEHSEPQ